MGLYKRSDRDGKRGPWYAAMSTIRESKFGSTQATDKQSAQSLVGTRKSDSARQETLDDNPDFLRSINRSGERIDFHALRHSCGAWLARANVHVKTIQSVMRVS